MSEQFSERQREILGAFRDPSFDYFEKRFTRAVPKSLRDFYSLGERLFHCKLISVDFDDGLQPLFVRGFLPLSPHAIDECEQFGFRLLSFAIGEEGELLLLGFDEVCSIYAWDAHLTDPPEPTGLSFNELVARLLLDPPGSSHSTC